MIVMRCSLLQSLGRRGEDLALDSGCVFRATYRRVVIIMERYFGLWCVSRRRTPGVHSAKYAHMDNPRLSRLRSSWWILSSKVCCLSILWTWLGGWALPRAWEADVQGYKEVVELKSCVPITWNSRSLQRARRKLQQTECFLCGRPIAACWRIRGLKRSWT